MRGHFQTEGMVILLNACVSPHPTRPPHQWKIARKIDYSSAKTGVVLFGDGVGVVEVLLKLYSMIVYFSSIIYYLPRKVTSPQIAIWHALIAECWLLIAECWLLIADCWLLITELIAYCWVLYCWLLIADCRLLIVNCWLLNAEHWLLITDCWFVIADLLCNSSWRVRTTSIWPRSRAKSSPVLPCI